MIMPARFYSPSRCFRLGLLSLALLAMGQLLTAGSPSKSNPKVRVKAAEGDERYEDVRRRLEDERDQFGPMAPGFLDNKIRQSQEVARTWGRTFPGVGRMKGMAAAATSGSTWTNIGPFTTSNIDAMYDADAGRPSVVLPHPTNPDIVYQAVSGGGVFMATNATSAGTWNWKAITDGLPTGAATGTIAVGALVMDPANPNTLFLGLGDTAATYTDQPSGDGKGLYKSTDGGLNWTLWGDWLQSGNNTTRIDQILCVNSSLIFVGGNDGLWRTTNGGTNWSRISIGTITTGYVWSIAKLSSTELILGYTDANDLNGAIYHSADSGATWAKSTLDATVPAFDRVTVRTSASNSTTAYAIAEDHATSNFLQGVLKSTDKGLTWTLVNGSAAPNRLFIDYAAYSSTDTGDGGQAYYNHCLIVDPDDSNRLFVGSNLALWRSMDGGSTWQQLTHWYAGTRVYAHADWHAANVYSNAGTKYFYFGNDGGMTILRDPWRTSIPSAAAGGAGVKKDITFIDNTKNVGISSHLIYNLGSTTATNAADAKSRVSIGLQDNGTRIRTDAGSGLQTSTQFDESISGDGFGTVWHPLDATKVLGSLYDVEVQRSTDGGANFKATTGIGGEGTPFRTILTLDESDPTGNTVYTGSNSLLYKSIDFGNTWASLTTPYTTSTTARLRGIAVAKTNSNAICVLTTSFVNITTNGGTSWTNVAANVPNSGGRYNYAWYDTSNASVIYLASVALDHTKSHLWKSMNGGTTWVAIDGAASGFPSGGIVHIVKNAPGSPNNLYIGTDYGVFNSTDGGTTWARFGNGLPSVRVSDIYIAPDNSFLRVATFGRGVWELGAASAGPNLDLDGNGTLDLRDLLFFAKYYGSTNATCDLNSDGTVNDADLTLLLAGL